MKRLLAVLSSVLIAVTFLFTSAQPAVAVNDLSLCSLTGSKPSAQLTDMDGHDYRVKGYASFSCPFVIDYNLQTEIKRDDGSNIWVVRTTNLTGSTIANYVVISGNMYSGCDYGSGRYQTKVTLTDTDSSQSRTWTSTKATLILDCQVYGGPNY